MKKFIAGILICGFIVMVFITYGSDNNVIVRIDHRYSGCFGSETNQLVVLNENRKVKAYFKRKGDGISKDTVLSKCHVDSLNNFISSLKSLQWDGICTTTEYYVIKTKKETIRKEDGGCSWRGFHGLVRYFFGEID